MMSPLELAPGAGSAFADAAPRAPSGSLAPPHWGVIGPNADADTTAEFYVHVYKVALCPKRFSHDWGACPFAHDKEKARRRDPRLFAYSSCICPNAAKGECRNGLQCPYAHTLFEYWLHPQRYRTQMCRGGTACRRSLCFFAHHPAELRAPAREACAAAAPLPDGVAAALAAPQCALADPAGAGELAGWASPAQLREGSFTQLRESSFTSSQGSISAAPSLFGDGGGELGFYQLAGAGLNPGGAQLVFMPATSAGLVAPPPQAPTAPELLLQLQVQQKQAELQQLQLQQKQAELQHLLLAQHSARAALAGDAVCGGGLAAPCTPGLPLPAASGAMLASAPCALGLSAGYAPCILSGPCAPGCDSAGNALSGEAVLGVSEPLAAHLVSVESWV
ncbi:Zinc finger CCCH domain-containing protein 2 [Scenedesmus sp. PABB004]|nr:Zinc finger CCCH domain-containing protein 2 [Scenedesmus sp. PABB004]